MNRDEQTVQAYLHDRFPKAAIVYEPDGNVPPDFAVNGELAVEVRRLNRHDFSMTPPLPFDRHQVSKWMAAEQLLASIVSEGHQETWFVAFDTEDDLGEAWRENRKEAEAYLRSKVGAPADAFLGTVLGNSLRLRFIKADRRHQSPFLLATIQDIGAGFGVVNALTENIEFLSAEKLATVSAYRGKYQKWTLALVDHICGYLKPTSPDVGLVRDSLGALSDWDEVILMPPGKPEDAFRI